MSTETERMCRLCGKNYNLPILIQVKARPIILKKIEKIFQLTIRESDKLPTEICISCRDRVEDAFGFYVSIWATDKKLRNMVNYAANEKESSPASDTIESNRERVRENPKIGFECPHCFQDFSTKTDLRGHVRLQHPNEMVKRMYNCRICLEQFESADKRDAHETIHANEKNYLCDYCGKTFSHSNYLRAHLNTHSTTRKKYFCDVCRKSFVTRALLKEHENSHTGKTPYRCEICGKSFHGRFNLRQHKWTHSGTLFYCSFCQQSFTRKGNMAAHVKEFHLEQKISAPEDKSNAAGSGDQLSESQVNDSSQPVKCKRCKSEFATKADLKMHSASHRDITFCNICGKQFKHHGSLTYHRRSAHTGERPFKCPHCDELFLLQSLLDIHIRRVHTGERPFQCDICKMKFITAATLRSHSQCHSKVTDFICEICGKEFRRSGSLKVHLKTHSGVRDHICSACGESFIQKNDMLKHKKSKHPDNLPFFCKFCGDSFAKKTEAVKHESCRRRALDGVATHPSEPEGNLDLAAQELFQ